MPQPNKAGSAKKATPNKPVGAERKVQYPEVYTEVCIGSKAITRKRAMELLGWQTTESKDDYLFVDNLGNKIICTNNDHNRRLDETWCRSLGQDILNHNFKFNGEGVIIGKTGTVLSAQHRLIGFILACQEWAGEYHGADAEQRKEHWQAKWPEEPVLETLVVYGIDETEDVKRTFDCTKPRVPADVFYTMGLFGAERITKTKEYNLSKMLDYGVRVAWDRTGAKNDAYSPYKTNSEVVEFVRRHEHLPRAVKDIYRDWSGIIEGKDKDKDGKKLKAPEYMVPFGTASGLLFLMAGSLADGDAYRAMEEMSEKGIDFKAKCPPNTMSKATTVWDRACEFWIFMRSGNNPLAKTVEATMQQLLNPTKEALSAGTLTAREKMVIIIKAWLAFRDGKPLTVKSCKPEYSPDPDNPGLGILNEYPVMGGIDCGGKSDEEEETTVATPEEQEAEKQKIRQERQEKARAEDKKPAAPTAKPSGNGELLSDEDKARIEQNKKPGVKVKAPVLKGGIGK